MIDLVIVILSAVVIGLLFISVNLWQYKRYASKVISSKEDELSREVSSNVVISENHAEKVDILKSEINTLQQSVDSLVDEVHIEKKKYKSLLSQKKSSEVNTGLIGEQLAPFLNDWPYDIKSFRFIGYPIDGLQVNDDGVVLIEIKTGNSRLSKQQKKVRDLVKEGKVYFEIFRINNKGCRLTRCNN